MDPSFTFTADMRTCILKSIEARVQMYNPAIAPGWLLPVDGSTQVATDVAYGSTQAGADWLSFVLPQGAPNSIVSTQGFVTPFTNILKSPQFYSDIEHNCSIPASNFTVLNKQITYTANSWAAADSNSDMTAPVYAAAPSSFSPFQILAVPFISLAALLRRD